MKSIAVVFRNTCTGGTFNYTFFGKTKNEAALNAANYVSAHPELTVVCFPNM